MGLPPMIKYTSSDELAVVQLDAPPVNAISFAMLEELRGAIARRGRRCVGPGDRDPRRRGPFQCRRRPGHFQRNPQRRRRRAYVARVPGSVSGNRGFTQTGGRRRGRTRTRRGPRTGHGLSHSRGRTGEPVQHARGQSGHQSGRGRHAAIAASGRAGRRVGDALGRPSDQPAASLRSRTDRLGLRAGLCW